MKAQRLALAFLGLHPDRRRALVDRWGPSPERLAAAIRRGRVEGLACDDLLPPDRCAAAMAAAGCRAVFLGDGDYPESLAETPDPPDVLFVRGALPTDTGVGVVGTRRCTAYGRRLAEGYGRAIAVSGWVAVSGLARGIDGSAHTGTVSAGGVGVAVLGCGLDVAYPREHRRLAEELVELGGAVISEYPPGTRPDGWRFPPRNRIISGLSAAVVVVESGVKGGALVTAMRAVEQGRQVFATPGDVGRESSIGCNLLIRDGAVPVLDPDDLVEALSLVPGVPLPRRIEGPSAGPDPASSIPSTGVGVDELGVMLGIAGPDLLSLLGRLELEGRVRREGDRVLPGGL